MWERQQRVALCHLTDNQISTIFLKRSPKVSSFRSLNSPASKKVPKQVGQNSYSIWNWVLSAILNIFTSHLGQSMSCISLYFLPTRLSPTSIRSAPWICLRFSFSSASNQIPPQLVQRSTSTFSYVNVSNSDSHLGQRIDPVSPGAFRGLEHISLISVLYPLETCTDI